MAIYEKGKTAILHVGIPYRFFFWQHVTIHHTTMAAEKKLTGLDSLSEADPELYDLIEKEKSRQWHSLELIASENFTSKGER
jgi:hypothetical protein